MISILSSRKMDTIYYETIGKPKYGREINIRYTDPLKYF